METSHGEKPQKVCLSNFFGVYYRHIPLYLGLYPLACSWDSGKEVLSSTFE